MRRRSSVRRLSQVFAQLGHGLIALLWRLRQTALHDCLQRGRRIQRHRLVCRIAAMVEIGVLSVERPPPAEQLVQHRSKAEYVRPRIERLALDLLRSHVIAAVPITVPSIVQSRRSAASSDAAVCLASPKSSSFTDPSEVTMMLAGFRSRCTTPLRCAASSASAICVASRTASWTPPAAGFARKGAAALRCIRAPGNPARCRRSDRCADDSARQSRAPPAQSAHCAGPSSRFTATRRLRRRVPRLPHFAHAALTQFREDLVGAKFVARGKRHRNRAR